MSFVLYLDEFNRIMDVLEPFIEGFTVSVHCEKDGDSEYILLMVEMGNMDVAPLFADFLNKVVERLLPNRKNIIKIEPFEESVKIMIQVF